MKTAISIWDGRISPLFDVSCEALLLTLESGRVRERRLERVETANAEGKVDRLRELGVSTLVCGAISAPLERELAASGVQVIAFVAGDTEEVIAALLANRLPAPALSMPGCCQRRRRFRGGRGPGGPGGPGGLGRGCRGAK